MASGSGTYGSLAAKDTMITILCEMRICRPQTSATEKVKSKISVEMSSAAIACQRGNLSALVYPTPCPYTWCAVLEGGWLFCICRHTRLWHCSPGTAHGLFPSQFTAIPSTDTITPTVLSPNVAQR